MDPNEALKNAREASRKFAAAVTADAAASHAVDLMMYFDNLDNWLVKGGYPPADWGGSSWVGVKS